MTEAVNFKIGKIVVLIKEGNESQFWRKMENGFLFLSVEGWNNECWT